VQNTRISKSFIKNTHSARTNRCFFQVSLFYKTMEGKDDDEATLNDKFLRVMREMPESGTR